MLINSLCKRNTEVEDLVEAIEDLLKIKKKVKIIMSF